jgi:hypothetical protein
MEDVFIALYAADIKCSAGLRINFCIGKNDGILCPQLLSLGPIF